MSAAGVIRSAGPQTHYEAGSDRFQAVQGSPTLYGRSLCGLANTPDRLTRDKRAVTCRACRRSMDRTPDDMRAQHEARRRKQERRRQAERTVLARHAEELEHELALLVLADLGG